MHPRHAIAQAREEERRALLPPLALDGPGRRQSILDLPPVGDVEPGTDTDSQEEILFDPETMSLVCPQMPPPPDLGENVFDTLREAVILALAAAGRRMVEALAVGAAGLAAIGAATIRRRAAATRALARMRLRAAHLCTTPRTLPTPILARAARV